MEYNGEENAKGIIAKEWTRAVIKEGTTYKCRDLTYLGGSGLASLKRCHFL